MGRQKKEDKNNAVREFCDFIRRKGEVEWRSAVIEEERREFFRGKDLLRYCEKYPEKLEQFCDMGSGRSISDCVDELCETMMKLELVFACDRFYKRPHPGRKHLVKFPRKLDARPRNGQVWDPEAFYVWLEERPMPPWQIALSIILAVVVLALCLFPLAPYKLRITVVYFFLGLMGLIFALIVLRLVLFIFVFTLSGYEFWLFPNMLSDEVDIIGAFKPFISFGKPEDGRSHIATRIGGFAGSAAMVYCMYVYSPDEKTIARNLREANDSILDMFHSANPQSIGDGTGYVPPKFGSERNIDVGSIRQHIMNENLRKRQEKARAKKEGKEYSSPEIPPLDFDVNDTEGIDDSEDTGVPDLEVDSKKDDIGTEGVESSDRKVEL